MHFWVHFSEYRKLNYDTSTAAVHSRRGKKGRPTDGQYQGRLEREGTRTGLFRRDWLGTLTPD